MGLESSPLLEASGLSAEGLGPLSLSLERGKISGLVGESGSGKSRLLRLLADLDPHAGDVSLNGRSRSLFSGPQWRQQVAYIPSETQWWGEVVADSFPDSASIDVAALGLPPDVVSRPVVQLSSGEKQRLALLRQLQTEPSVLLMDEPTANLDAESTSRFEAMTRHWLAEGERAVLWISHDPEQISRLCESCLRIAQGRLFTGRDRG